MAATKAYSEYTYHDIIGYDYGNDKILMEGGRWIGVEYLRHLPRATQYANADPNKRLKILEEEGLKGLDEIRNKMAKERMMTTYDLDTGKMRKAMEAMSIDIEKAMASMSPAMRELAKFVETKGKHPALRSTPPTIRGKDGSAKVEKKPKPKKMATPLADRMKKIGG